MVRQPQKLFGTVAVSHKYYTDERTARRYFATIGYAEGRLNSGVPMVTAFAEMLLAWGQGRQLLQEVLKQYRYKNIPPELQVTVTEAARASFELAFGYSPRQQRIFEAMCETSHEMTWEEGSTGATWLEEFSFF